MKKLISLLAIITFGLSLASCASMVTTTQPTLGTTLPEGAVPRINVGLNDYEIDTELTENVELTFWHAFGTDKAALLQDMINEFTAQYPKVTVTLASQGGYDDLRSKVNKAIVTGDTPDMLIGYPDHIADYLTGHAVVSLDPFINNEVVGYTDDELLDFIPSYIQENQQFGKTYGLPFNKSTEVLIYNKTFFDANDLDVPTTWDEVAAVSEQIHTLTGKWGFAYDSLGNMFITLTRQWGGQYTNSAGQLLFDNQSAKDALTFYKNNHDAGKLTVPAEWEQSYASTPFVNKEVYMTVGSTAGVNYNVPTTGDRFEVGIAPIPQKDADHKAVIQQGTNISIMSSTTSQERLAAWLLTKFLASKDQTIFWAMETGYLPVRKSAVDSTVYQAYLNDPEEDYKYTSMAAKAAYEQQDYFYYDPAFVGSSNVLAQAEIIISSVLYGGKTPDEAIKYAMSKLNWQS